MADKDGNTDTKEMFEHLDAAMYPLRRSLEATQHLQSYVGAFTTVYLNAQIEIAKSAHPDCVVCQTFAGNPPR